MTTGLSAAQIIWAVSLIAVGGLACFLAERQVKHLERRDRRAR